MTAMMCALAPSMHCLAPLSSTLSELEPARGKLMITPPFSTEISWISWERGGEVSEFQYPQEKKKKRQKECILQSFSMWAAAAAEQVVSHTTAYQMIPLSKTNRASFHFPKKNKHHSWLKRMKRTKTRSYQHSCTHTQQHNRGIAHTMQ